MMATCSRQPFVSQAGMGMQKAVHLNLPSRLNKKLSETAYLLHVFSTMRDRCEHPSGKRSGKVPQLSKVRGSETQRERPKRDATVALAALSGTLRARGTDRETDSESQIVFVFTLPSA